MRAGTFGEHFGRSGIAGACARDLPKAQSHEFEIKTLPFSPNMSWQLPTAMGLLSLALRISSASPHENRWVEATLQARFCPSLPSRVIGDKA
jgi:hypothetical protein